ncbi:DUF2309 family protein [Erythrobacteraceae bacterium CFH 75059]|uniref:putative inorganic carbon transporter subunit DabA n=1 Tax=Qipengyuania thermophila TaxID=2509361 RepID=UPI0010213B48|nr:putative inorganic carbon transporter subunit DabA [Qipengyuania thermophila]TCD04296.1 DUF2309 family protein [Erythrobacteraceae bacterium CFH 75059]
MKPATLLAPAHPAEAASPVPATRQFTRAELALAVELAARTVPPLWPLDGAIAVNPLSGFETEPFGKAVRLAAETFRARPWLPLALWRRLLTDGAVEEAALRTAATAWLGGPDAAAANVAAGVSRLDLLMARLLHLPEDPAPQPVTDPAALLVADACAAYFSRPVVAFGSAAATGGLFALARALVTEQMPRARRADTATCPAQPLDAIGWALGREGAADANPQTRLARCVARLPGWAGHIRWRTEQADPDMAAEAPADMADLIAALLFADAVLGAPEAAPMRHDPAATVRQLAQHLGLDAPLPDTVEEIVALDPAALSLLFMQAAEDSFTTPLLARLSAAQTSAGRSDAHVPDAQLVFCIDVRSEPMRRAVEAQGAYQTVGYAGFFGLMIAVAEPGQRRQRQLPVLVSPQHDLALLPARGCEGEAERLRTRRHRRAAALTLFDRLKAGSATAYATAETVGAAAGAWMALRTAAPLLARRLLRRQGDPHALMPSLDPHGSCTGLTPDERLAYARGFIALTGIRPQSRLVVLTGHAGEAVNNPYASALDCGACAGHGGAPNARVLAAIFNEPAIRAALDIPEQCWFLGAEHNTTTDEIRLFDTHLAPASHHGDIAALSASLVEAGAGVRAARATRLHRPADDLARGAAHWAEVRPEWGLTGNAAFIVAPRSLTRSVDLGGAAFLHDYDWRGDASGEALATILTAPMVVAQWINCQYLFSTADNEVLGAGDKTVHNPVGGFGVLRGNGGDLAIGLPRQSLFHDDGTPAHVPRRLTTIVEAPVEHVRAVVEGQDVLRRLFGNGWVHLVILDPITGQQHRWPSVPLS